MPIRFIEPRPAGHHLYDLAVLPRLGPPLMATLLAEQGHDVRCYCETLADVDVGDCLGADLVGISGTTSTQPRAYALADDLAAAGVPVVLGGSHVTFLADEASTTRRWSCGARGSEPSANSSMRSSAAKAWRASPGCRGVARLVSITTTRRARGAARLSSKPCRSPT